MNNASTQQEAWPVQVFRHSPGKGWESVNNKGDIDSDDPVTATPRHGGIEIHKFRVRLSLFPKTDERDFTDHSYGYASRRLDKIYCPSRSSSGALILKFRDKEACIGFYDRLVALNPTETTEGLKAHRQQDDTGNGKRRANPSLDLTSYGDEVSVKRRKFETMSYIVRLLHDDGFHKFVDDIEATLMSTVDGASILAAMKRSGGDRPTDNV